MINCTRCAPVLPVSRLYEKHRPKYAVCLCVRLSLSLPFLAPSLSLSLAVGDGQRREKSPPPPIPRVVPMVNARRPGIKNVSPTNQFLKKIVLYKRSVSCGRVLASVPCRERLFRLNPNSTWLSSPSCFRHGSLRISRRSGEGGVAKHAYHKTIQQKAAGGRGSDARSARSTDAEPQPLFERTSPNAAQLYRVCCLVVTISKTGPQVFVERRGTTPTMNEIQSSKNNNNNTRAALAGGDGKAGGGCCAPRRGAVLRTPPSPFSTLSFCPLYRTRFCVFRERQGNKRE